MGIVASQAKDARPSVTLKS